MAADDDLPWTTSRCNRLLRPLSSKLAKLRKELEQPRGSHGEKRNASSAFAIKGSPQKTTNFTRPAHKPRGFEKARDPDWRPGTKPGGSKKTYGGRGVKRTQFQRGSPGAGIASRPGEIAFTPLIARIGTQFHSSPMLQISPLKKYAKNRGPLLATIDQGLAKNVSGGDLQKLIHGLSEAYANVLQATMSGNEKRWKGTRSLMSACLRRLPAYIELEEHFAELDRLEDEEEERDVANEIYDHLETQFEQRAGQGWRPFKQVVRAHGTSLLCEAIADEILGLESLSVLVTHCLNVAAWDEAENLLLAYVSLLEPLPIPINVRTDLFDAQRSPYLFMIKSFVDRTGRYRLLYDLLEHMIALELLPLEWLATECMRPIWDRLVQAISDSNHRTSANALRFMETATIASMGLPDSRLLEDQVTGSVARRFIPSSRDELRQALNTTFSSLLTVLCSIALVNSSRDDITGKDIARRITWAIDAIAITISGREDIKTEMSMLQADPEDVQIFAQRALWAMFASVMLRLDNCLQDSSIISWNIQSLISSVNWIAIQYASASVNFVSIFTSLPSLISSTARGTGRIWKDDGFDQLHRLVAALMTLSGCRLSHELWTLKRVALESALEFAHSTGDVQHMAYAREVERKMRSQGRLVINHSPAKNDSPSASGGFRWEEGIGEWVACTPFVKQEVKRLTKKPVRALELLPTPLQSEDEKANSSEDDELPRSSNDSLIWGPTAFDYEEEDAILQSSPIKQAPRTSTSSLGKRARAPSPMVVITAKRMHMTHSAPVIIDYYPDLPEEKEDRDGPRRSRRPRSDIQALTSRLRTQRSRASLESGLRHLSRPTYVETQVLDDSDRVTASPSNNSEVSSSSVSSAQSGSPNLRARSTSTKQPYRQRAKTNQGDTKEGDELGKTPGRPISKQKRTSSRTCAQGNREWWKVGGGIVNDSGQESEDELSFH
ncbi:hypothetical protein BKA66DRAFT_418604 [Pyrenochaeta sp. MPI-SDFR-AT-0127]|nr:hypothetical protein BKA66DRAFT_418604 [Pyrenochaeta sp. MPI-SDFR-AT-0127]